MKNYKITVQYDGTRYNGWQKQGNTQNTIQERFENVLSRMCDCRVEIFASGRTDAGVHALCQVANFKCNTDKNEREIMDYLNGYLPEDIRVLTLEEVPERFHSRLNAKAKTYEYAIAYSKPDVFSRKYVWYAPVRPDVDKMCRAAKWLEGTHDFRGFSSLGKTKKSTVRTINFIKINDENGVIHIIVNGNGFLHNTVRIIAGTLYEIGIGKLNEDAIYIVFEAQIRENAGATLPAKGLKLVEVEY